MALGTSEGTGGIGQQGAPPMGAVNPPPDPVLFDDIDPVLLLRVHPEAKDIAEAKTMAMAAGQAAKAAGETLMAAQQEPVPGTEPQPDPPPPPPADPPPADPPPP